CSPADLGPTTKTAVAQLARASFAEAKRQASLGGISPLGNLKDDRVYLFSGTYDGVTPQGVVDALFDFYAATDKAALAPGNIDYNRTFPAPHTMVRDGFERPTGGVVGDCTPTPARSAAKNTYIDDCEPIANRQQAQSQCLCPASQAKATPGTPCPPSNKQATCRDLADVDLAGAILKQIYGGPALKAGRVPLPEAAVQAFDQRHVFSHFSGMPYNARQNASMAKEGYVYIPAACKDGRRCRLHVAFHGCQQGGQTDRRPGHAGNLYAKFAGYNEWAKANDIIVLYPQVEARSATAPSNPAGCWDWWGQNYTHEGYHTQRGKQVKAVAQMINILLGGEPRLAVPPE
ncbi:MAG TPA: hypothetical protein VES73_05330, partial [Lamprocystis sp. (in: g-proteobacteria)]|nr:hypothetical protein [Lamprocystis sp. (in: g-proteobacteria)]